MSKKDAILKRCAEAVEGRRIEMPDLSDIDPLTFPDPLEAFRQTAVAMGSRVADLAEGETIDDIIRREYPDAVTIASNLPEVTIATANPDTVESAAALNGTDVGVIRGSFGVAENGCIWIEQDMKERDVCFICENLVITVPRSRIVSNMHEAYRQITFNSNGYGVFISGPSKTADIAQVLVTGAQAARSLTVILLPD